MAERPSVENYYTWARACLIFIGVLIAGSLAKGMSEATGHLWPLLPLVPLPFIFLVNLWLTFKRGSRALQQMVGAPPHAARNMMENLFGMTITAACGLVIAVVVGLLIGKTIAR